MENRQPAGPLLAALVSVAMATGCPPCGSPGPSSVAPEPSLPPPGKTVPAGCPERALAERAAPLPPLDCGTSLARIELHVDGCDGEPPRTLSVNDGPGDALAWRLELLTLQVRIAREGPPAWGFTADYQLPKPERRYASGAYHPRSIAVEAEGFACHDDGTGRYEIREFPRGVRGEAGRLEVQFELRCRGRRERVTGCVRYEVPASEPPADAQAAPNEAEPAYRLREPMGIPRPFP